MQGGLTQLSDGAYALDDGLGLIWQGGQTLKDGTYTVSTGSAQLLEGAEKLSDGSGTLYAGITTLDDGAAKLKDGSQKLEDGAKKLNSGMKKFRREGIDKIINAYNDDITPLLDRLDALKEASKAYDNFSGKAADTEGEVKFIYETAPVAVDKKED